MMSEEFMRWVIGAAGVAVAGAIAALWQSLQKQISDAKAREDRMATALEKYNSEDKTEMREVIDRNTEAMHKHASSLDRLTETLTGKRAQETHT